MQFCILLNKVFLIVYIYFFFSFSVINLDLKVVFSYNLFYQNHNIYIKVKA